MRLTEGTSHLLATIRSRKISVTYSDEGTGRQKWMLLYMSSDFIEYLVGLLDGRVDLSSHIALQTSNDFSFTHSLCGATTHICLGTQIVTQPDHNDAIECRVGLAVATAVETMPVGLAG